MKFRRLHKNRPSAVSQSHFREPYLAQISEPFRRTFQIKKNKISSSQTSVTGKDSTGDQAEGEDDGGELDQDRSNEAGYEGEDNQFSRERSHHHSSVDSQKHSKREPPIVQNGEYSEPEKPYGQVQVKLKKSRKMDKMARS